MHIDGKFWHTFVYCFHNFVLKYSNRSILSIGKGFINLRELNIFVIQLKNIQKLSVILEWKNGGQKASELEGTKNYHGHFVFSVYNNLLYVFLMYEDKGCV